MDDLFYAFVVLWTAFIQPNDDLGNIKAQYEGLLGRAGPYVQVVAITPLGFDWDAWARFAFQIASPTAFYPRSSIRRYYDVMLRGPDGLTFGRQVGVSLDAFGPGQMFEVG